MAQSNSKPPLGQNLGIGSLHSNPSSSPSYGNNRFPSIIPLPPQSHDQSSFCSRPTTVKDASMEDLDVVSPRGSFLVLGSSSSSFALDNKSKPNFDNKKINSSDGNTVLEDQRKCEGGEVIDDGLFITYMNLDRYNVDSTNINKRNIAFGDGDFAARARTATNHYLIRSLSVDDGGAANAFDHQSPNNYNNAFIIGKSIPVPTQSHDSDVNIEDSSAAKLSFGFGNGEFNEYELNRIKNDEKLAEVALLDPKRAKRILANRHSAARSKERKTRYISELEHKVQTLQTKATTLSNQLTIVQKDITDLTNHNNELKFRLQAMEQHARLRDALHGALSEEVKHLKLAANELGKDGDESSRVQHMLFKHQMLHMDRQQFSVGSTTNSVTPAS